MLIPIHGVVKTVIGDGTIIVSVDMASPLQGQLTVELQPQVESEKLMVRVLSAKWIQNSLPNFFNDLIETVLNKFLSSGKLRKVRFTQITVGYPILLAYEVDGKSFAVRLVL